MATNQDSVTAQELVTLLTNIATQESQGKPSWKSKTVWVNLIAVIASFLAPQFGIVLDANLQLLTLAVINLVLRRITKEPLTWF